MIRPIVKYGDQTLHRPAERVDAVTPELQVLIDDMIDTMYAAPGIGLAAPQVGVGLRLFVVDISVGRRAEDLLVFVNPEFVEREGMQLEEEGCLSVPGFTATVARPSRAVVKGLDRHGKRTHRRGQGSARASLPARDGSSRRHAVRQSAARDQARHHRPQDPEADAGRRMVDCAAARDRFLRHARICRADAPGAPPLAPSGGRGRVAARPAARARPEAAALRR